MLRHASAGGRSICQKLAFIEDNLGLHEATMLLVTSSWRSKMSARARSICSAQTWCRSSFR